MLLGRVAEIGRSHPAATALRTGERIATLVSLTLTPLALHRIRAVHVASERVDCEGRAILFATGPWARVPADLPEPVTLAALDVCGAPALVARHLRSGQRILVLGAGKAGALVGALARQRLGVDAEVVAVDRSPDALAGVAAAGACTRTVVADATDAVGTSAALDAAHRPFDLVVSCTSVPGSEMAALLAVKEGGTVIFFSMATSFTAAALGAEGIARDASLVIGAGYVPGHADLTLDLLRTNPGLRALFERRAAAQSSP
jgi:L-erythro-3,5-diaminohexanoate dehydrogenase